MKRALLLLVLLSTFFAASTRAETPADERGERALRGLLSGRRAWVAEADPARWTEATWKAAGLTVSDWDAALARWQELDPKVREKIVTGRKFRDEYLGKLAEDARKRIDPKDERPAALDRMIRDYAAFAASQKRFNLGPPTEQQAEDFANNQTAALRDYVLGAGGDPSLKFWLDKQHLKEKRKADETEFPAKNPGAKTDEWERWNERNRGLAEAEILERFKAALLAALETSDAKLRVGGKRIRSSRVAALELSIDWETGAIQSKAGKLLKFDGDEKIKVELETFLKPIEATPSAGIDAKRDLSWTVARRLRLEAQAIHAATIQLDKTLAKTPTRHVMGALQRVGRQTRDTLSDALASSPLKKLAHTPGGAADEILEAALWDGYRQSPKYFRKRNGFFRFAYPLEQVAGRRWLSKGVRSHLGLIVVGGLLMTLGSDQAWQHRDAIEAWSQRRLTEGAEFIADNVDLENENWVPDEVKKWVRERVPESASAQTSAVQDGELQLPSKGFRNNGKLPNPVEVLKRNQTPTDFYDGSGEPLTTGTKGFSQRATMPYDIQAELAKLSPADVANPDKILAIETKFPMATENGKLLIPHSEGFVLKSVSAKFKPLNGGSPVQFWFGQPGSLATVERSGEKFYVVDVGRVPDITSRVDIKSASFSSEYVQMPRADYLQADLAISDPDLVAELAEHFREAGFGRIAEGLHEEAGWMKKLGYSIYPNDVAKRIEMGSLYAQTKNPRSRIKVGPGNLFADVLDLAVEQYLCTQCAGSAEVSERSLKFLYRSKNVSVRQRTVLPGYYYNWTVPYHAQVEVQAGENPVVVVDATAKEQDPRNAQGKTPTTHALRTPGQADPFAEHKLPRLEGPEGAPVPAEEMPPAPASEKNTPAPERKKGPLSLLYEALEEIGPANHRFRNRGQIPGTEDDVESETTREKARDPRILEALKKIDAARDQLLDEPAYRRLPAQVRESEKSMPLALLYRAYLLGDITKEKFLEGVRFLLPEDSALRNEAEPSTQAVLREIATQQRKMFASLMEKARGSATPKLKSMADPSMIDRILALHDEIAKPDADVWVNPPPRRTARARVAGCVNWMLGLVRLR